MTIIKMTTEEIDKKWTPKKIKSMIAKAKKKPEDKSEIVTDDDITSGRVRKVGRPKKKFPKKRTDICFDQDVLAGMKLYFGHGWSAEVNNTMRKFLVRKGLLKKIEP